MPDTYIKFDGVDGEARAELEKLGLKLDNELVELVEAFFDQPEVEQFEFHVLNPPSRSDQPGEKFMFIKYESLKTDQRDFEEIVASIEESPDYNLDGLTLQLVGNGSGQSFPFLKIGDIKGEIVKGELDPIGQPITDISDDFLI